ncbi:MAG: hypothetical protein ABL940_08615 [Bacteroidia bacterium]
MKKTMAVMLSINLFATQNTTAQNDSTRTLLHLPKIKTVGVYIAPELQYGQLSNAFTSFGGFSAMALFNKKLAVGVTTQRSLDRNYSPTAVFPLYMQSNFGGLKLEYILNPNAPIHVSFPLTIGMGSVSAGTLNNRQNRTYDATNDSLPHTRRNGNGSSYNADRTTYFVIQPGVNVEANLFKYVKAFAGVNYRFGIENNISSAVPTNAIQGVSGTVGIKVGLFEISTACKKKTNIK